MAGTSADLRCSWSHAVFPLRTIDWEHQKTCGGNPLCRVFPVNPVFRPHFQSPPGDRSWATPGLVADDHRAEIRSSSQSCQREITAEPSRLSVVDMVAMLRPLRWPRRDNELTDMAPWDSVTC